jgi:hypothetical protein
MIAIKTVLRTLARLIPFALRMQLNSFKVLAIDFGQWRSIKENVPVDKEGSPIPWYTYPAIEYLKRLDVREKTIFEWGSGNSSLFWARRAKEVVSIEDDKKWFSLISESKLRNQRILLIDEKVHYVEGVLSENKKFDIIVIDGKYRFECSKKAIQCLSEGGLIILDNSDWFPNTAKVLRGAGLNQVDFIGAGPINSYAWCTSLFFQEQLTIPRRSDQEAVEVQGGLVQVSERE